MKDEHTYGKKMTRKRRKKVIYKGTFISIQTLVIYYILILTNQRNNIRVFRGLDIWDITSIIANSELVIGTSLHVRIIAFAFAIPRVTFSAGRKHESMINHWDYGAIECKIEAIQVDQIFETSMQTMACDAFKTEKYGHLALEMYMEMFQNMIHTMGICS